MARCSYKTLFPDKEWECPLDVLTGEEYCYWHKEEDGKEPTKGQLVGLKRERILGVYLKKSNLSGGNLQKTYIGKANFREANLTDTNLREAYMIFADFQEANLFRTNLEDSLLLAANFMNAVLTATNFENAYLQAANFENAGLREVNFQKANLIGSNIQRANLIRVNLHEANLMSANLQGANLLGARFDSQTVLDESILIGANLYRSYFDEAKSFRNATVFQKEGDKEINEIVGDALACGVIWILENDDEYPAKTISKITSFVVNKKLNKKLHIPLPLKPSALDMKTIEKKAPDVAAKLRGEGLIRYAPKGHKIIFFDWQSECAIKNPENGLRHKDNLIRVEELSDLLQKDGKIQSEFLYKGSRAFLYEASYEVYNNLYNFYIANGRLDQAAHVHYRRGEAHRKLRWARGGFKNKARSIFDLLILRTLTGYGDRIGRPIAVSGLIIGLFAFLFWLSDGIVKNVNGKPAAPDWVDYIYHSITTFTSLGYSNIQPNLAAGHLPQILVAAESGLGILMMALIIFVVTYQVSR